MQTKTKKIAFLALGLGMAGFLSPRASAQDPGEGSERQEALKAWKEVAKRFPEERQRLLSGAAQNLFHLVERSDKILSEREDFPRREGLTEAPFGPALGPAPPGGVSDPSSDLILSRLSGFTQSETSTAWCGNTVVVGFNDSGSLLETLPLPIALSLNGFARSGNRGATFVDLGFLNGGPNFFDILVGDPVLACTNANTFYYASLFETFTPPATFGSAISVSRSFNGGLSWGNPIVAVSKDGRTHFLDKEWMAVDPTNASRLYVTYTDFDDSGAVCGLDASGRPISRGAIELVRSTNGGSTWSAPLVLASVCANTNRDVQGSQVAVGPTGEVYVAWELFASFPGGARQISIKKSTNNGVTFGSTVKVDDVTCIGGCFTVRGGFRTFIDLQGLAVDRSGTTSNGHVYVGWHDGRNLQVPDLDSFNGFYNFGDILVRRSTDGGATWSSLGAAPVKVNNNEEPLPSGEGSDQFMPGMAVDRTGKLGVCWYDRRRDPHNFFVHRWCATSTNGGANWSNVRKTERPFAPIHATDFEINPFYMGDYDALASDFTKANAGFVGAFQFINGRGNPDVRSNHLP